MASLPVYIAGWTPSEWPNVQRDENIRFPPKVLGAVATQGAIMSKQHHPTIYAGLACSKCDGVMVANAAYCHHCGNKN